MVCKMNNSEHAHDLTKCVPNLIFSFFILLMFFSHLVLDSSTISFSSEKCGFLKKGALYGTKQLLYCFYFVQANIDWSRDVIANQHTQINENNKVQGYNIFLIRPLWGLAYFGKMYDWCSFSCHIMNSRTQGAFTWKISIRNILIIIKMS